MLDKLKGMYKSKGSFLIIIGLALGAVLLLMSGVDSGEKSATSAVTEKSQTEVADSYVSTLEIRVKTLLEAMDGISDAQVIITAESTTETVFAENRKFADGELTEKEYVIRPESGEAIALNLVYPRLRGIAVVCRGGSNPIIQQRVINLLCALFDLSSDRVYVSG